MKTINRNKTVLATIAAVAIMLGAQLALAQAPGGQGFGGRGNGGPGHGQRGQGDCMQHEGQGQGRLGARMAERLELTEDQQEAMDALREEGRGQTLELRKTMMRLRNELRGEMLQDDPSEGKVLDLNEKIGEIRTELQSNRIQHKLAVRELLTPEQRDRMLLMREHGRQDKRGGRRGGPRGGDCDGPGSGRGPQRRAD